jgi:hypothetical protein
MQKLKVVFDKENFIKQLQKMQFFKKYDDSAHLLLTVHENSLPIANFL